MNKRALLVVILSLVLFVSVGVNSFIVNQNNALTKANDSQATLLEMVSILTQVKVTVDSELHRIGSSIIYASQQLSTTGLSGEDARDVLRALAANSSFIIDAASTNLNNVIVTVEPASYSDAESKYIGEQEYLNSRSQNPLRPALTDMMPMVEGFNCSVIVAPIFASNGSMIGSVSAIFDPNAIIAFAVTSSMGDKLYEFTTLQLDGRILYDTLSTLQGTYIFTDPIYSGYPEMVTLAYHMVEETAGYGTYEYTLPKSGQSLHKEFYWTTIGAYGTEWRLAIFNTTNA